MSDEVIVCVECGRSFTWSSGEQRYFRERGLERPKRCQACREQRRAEGRPGMQSWSSPAPATSNSPNRRRPQPASIPRSAPRAWMARPEFRFGAATFVAAYLVASVFFVAFAFDGLLSWLIGINLVTLLSYGYDKAIAGSKRTRVPEDVLLVLAVIGGGVGAWVGMRLFHHKTEKRRFQRAFWLIMIVQVVLVAAYFVITKP